MARKLAIRPTEIVEFLTKRNIKIEDGSNTRLEDDHVTLIMQKFAPARAAEVAAELAVEKEKEMEVDLIQEISTVTIQATEEVIKELPVSVMESQSEKIELIKAPKVELSGLKVLGKIELPELKKKEPDTLNDEASADQTPKVETRLVESEKKPRQENRKPYPGRRENELRPGKNPIALQRERESQEAEKRRRAQAEQEKEKRTQHYLKKVKASAPTKSVKLINEDVEEMTPLVPVPKTLWGKFMKWLNT